MVERQYETAVNGSQILTVGILSLFVFPFILGPVAWVMGNRALATLSEGGDPAQRGSVVAGRICGIVGTGLGIFWLLWFMFMGGLTILSVMFGGAHS